MLSKAAKRYIRKHRTLVSDALNMNFTHIKVFWNPDYNPNSEWVKCSVWNWRKGEYELLTFHQSDYKEAIYSL